MSTINAQNLFSVDGLVAVVTGGGTGIGLMATKALAMNGAARVYIMGRRKDVLEEVAKTFPGVVVPIAGDITSKDFLWKAAEQIQSEMGYVNVVIANAGIDGAKTKAVKPTMSISEIRQQLWAPSTDEFTEAFSVNTVGVYYTFVAFLELLDAGNRKGNVEQQSQFIATTSVSAYNRKPMSSFSYCLSKAATTQLLKALSTNMAPHEIRANILCPGLYPSDLTTAAFAGKDGSKKGSFPADSIPATRAGTEEDIAGAILFLVSRAGAYCNGCVMLSDGGRTGIFPSSF